jgi:photosystem II stability/assembly factor-like uncharacterized protein
MRLATAASLVVLMLASPSTAPAGPQRLPRGELIELARAVPERAEVGTLSRALPASPSALSWTALGPQPIEFDYWSQGQASGRVSSIAVSSVDPSVAYVAAAHGGVWKTTDGGATWAPLTDGLSSLASGALAIDPSDDDVIYYATGEQHEAFDSYFGDGLFRSSDAGANWVKIATRAQIGDYVARIAVHPETPSLLFAASSRGLLRSVDGGFTWSVREGADWGYDLLIHPTDPDVLYATIYANGVYKSVDAGATWTPLAGGLPASGFYRIQIGIGVSDPQVLYAGFVNGSGGLLGMYKSTDGGDNWAQLANVPNYLGGQGWYDHCLIVDPSDADVCYAGGVYPYGAGIAGIIKTADGGVNWTDVTFGIDDLPVHPDQHAFAFGPDGTLWLGNDGGVWKSTNGASTWINCNDGLEITQFYSLALHPTDPDLILGGTQDNGALIYRGSEVWPQVVSGDGGPVAFEFDSPNLFYTTYVAQNPTYKWDDGNFLADVTGPWAGVDRASAFLGPMVADPHVANAVMTGTQRVWRTVNSGATWTPISPDLTGGGVLYGIAVAPNSPGVYYASSSDGRVHVTSDGGTNWFLRNGGLPASRLRDVVVDPSDPDRAWVCSDVAAGGRLWSTTDAGVIWSNVSGDLPPGVRGMALAMDFSASPPTLFLGTDFGVFSSPNAGANWTREPVPGTMIYDLGVGNGFVVAATHGRGMFRAPLAAVGVGADTRLPAQLLAVRPNPSRAPVRFEFRLAEAGEARLEVYDLAGRLVRVLASGAHGAGRHAVAWDGRDARGRAVGGGVLFYRLQAGGRAENRRFVILR